MSENMNANDIAKVVKQNTAPISIQVTKGNVEETNVLLIPDGMKPYSLKKYMDEYREKPERRTGCVCLDRIASFISICNRFKSENSVIFASASITDNSIQARVRAIFDYHPAGDDVNNADNSGHSALYNFPTSKEFNFWISNNAKPMEQMDFALFLEERHIEMCVAIEHEVTFINGLKPKFADPLEILELSKDLEIYSNETFRSKNKLSSGETEIKFSSEHVDAGGAPISIPDFFMINIPVFEGGTSERIMVRLRYRMNSGKIKWFYDLYRIDNILNKSFENSCEYIIAGTGMPLFFGSQE